METKVEIARFDEIVFENRNKLYGAYLLRNMYNKQLVKAVIIATLILAAGLAYPVVNGYKLRSRIVHVNVEPGEVIFNGHIDKPDVPIPPAAKHNEKDNLNKFNNLKPIITLQDVPEGEGFQMPDNSVGNDPLSVPDIDLVTPEPELKNVIEIPDEKEPMIIATEMPEFPGGESERIKFLSKNINYPNTAADLHIEGTVYLSFVVDTKGNITDVKVLRGIFKECDDEAVRVLYAMPKWKPGRQNGTAVRVIFHTGITFRLNV
jgi:protein TonB